MKSAGKARNNGLYRHIRTSKEIIRNLLNDYIKYIGTFRIAIRHRQKETFSAQRFYCSKRIAVFPYVMTRHRWSLTFRTPASFRLINSPKSSFIFKHQSDSFGLVLGLGIQHTGFNFFEASQASSSAAFGCLERGIFLLQPCLFNTL